MEFPPKNPVNDLPDVPARPDFTSGIPGFVDTFFGPNDKTYADRRMAEVAKLRGVDCYYYKLIDETERIDGNAPTTDLSPSSAAADAERLNTKIAPSGESIPPVQQVRRRSGNVAFYGEPVVIRGRIDSTRREVAPDWRYSQPILLRAVGLKPEKEEEADERGMVVTRKLELQIPRILMEQATYVVDGKVYTGLYPRPNDVIRLPNLMDSFYDVLHVDRNTHRFGAFGFYTAFKFDLIRKTIFEPERKLQGE